MFASLPQDSLVLESQFEHVGSAQNHRARSIDTVFAAPQPVFSAWGKIATQWRKDAKNAKEHKGKRSKIKYSEGGEPSPEISGTSGSGG